MGDDAGGGLATVAALPHAVAVSVVRGGMVPGAQTTDGGGDEKSGAGLAAVENGPIGENNDDLTRGGREMALAMVALLVATSGLGCEDHDSIRAWRDLGMCSRRLAGWTPGARATTAHSQYGWWLRRWWTRVSVAEARAAHDRFLLRTLGLEQRTPEGRFTAWRGLILEQRSTRGSEMVI